MISKLQDQQAAWNDVDRQSKSGDQLNIDFEENVSRYLRW